MTASTFDSSAKAKMLAAIRARQEAQGAKDTAAGIAKQHMMAHIPLAAINSANPEVQDAIELIQGYKEYVKPAILLNEQQSLAVQKAVAGEEFCLIGAAGTGKTTTVCELMRQVIAKIQSENAGEVPKGAIAIVSFTRRAVRNIAKAVKSVGADRYCSTIHSYLEYAPNRDGYMDEQGNWKTAMRFEPKVTALCPNNACKLIIVEEASMCGYSSLYRELREGSPNAKFIFIGDLNQLPPVFGDAVLGFKLAQLPVVELTQVYRQAMDSPIIWFQHNFTLKGAIPTETLLRELSAKATDSHGCNFIPYKHNHTDGEVMAEGVAHYMMRQYDAGLYDPIQDTILIPFNKAFGSIAINLHIAEHLAKKQELEVWEVIASYEKRYYAVSDFVMYEKKECVITEIKPNVKYFGMTPQLPSVDLSRYGYIRSGGKAPVVNLDAHADFMSLSAQSILDMTNPSATGEEKTTAASHVIYLRDCETGQEFQISTTGEVRGLDYGYCMTIHKSQGSEWRKVWLVLHQLHATMLSRELIYTGMTRARELLTVFYTGPTATGRTDSTISKCMKKAVIPGTGWKSKVEYFKGKKESAGVMGGWHD